MAGPGLRTDNDARFLDSTVSPDVKEHQQVHDKLASVANQLGILEVTKQDGEVLAWDASVGMFVPTPIVASDGGTPVQTTYTTAAPGTVFRLLYQGGWPATRPSSRSDISFDLIGQAVDTPDPAWMLQVDRSERRLLQLIAQVQQLTNCGSAGLNVDAVQEVVGQMAGTGMAFDPTVNKLNVTASGGGATDLPAGAVVRPVWDDATSTWRIGTVVMNGRWNSRNDIRHDFIGGLDSDRPTWGNLDGDSHEVTQTA